MTSVLESFDNKISNVLKNSVSKAIEKVAEMERVSAAVHRHQLHLNQSNESIYRDRDDSRKLIVTGVPETGDSINDRIDNDFTELDGILNQIGPKADDNVNSFRRLGKSMSQSGERRNFRPLLITCESPHFLSRCFARSFKFQDYNHSFYMKKFLSAFEQGIKKFYSSKTVRHYSSGR